MFLRPEVDSRQEHVAVRVPRAARVVVAEHRGGGLGLLGHAEREVGFDQPEHRLGHVGGRLVVLDDRAEAVDRGQVLAFLQIEAADFHMLAGQVVARQVELQRRIARIAGLGEAADDLLKSQEGKPGHLLVAADVGDLLVVADRPQVMGVGDVLVTRMELDEAVERVDRLVVFVALIVGEGGHQLGLGGPGRIGVLALDLVEQAGGFEIVADQHGVHGGVVQVLDRALDVLGLVFPPEQRAGREHQAQTGHRQHPAGAPEPPAGCADCAHTVRDLASRVPRPGFSSGTTICA